MLQKAILANFNHDYSSLECNDSYARYHDHLIDVMKKFMSQKDSLLEDDRLDVDDMEYLKFWVARFLYTIRVLRIKYLHHPDHMPKMFIDMSNSSFPNHNAISSLGSDLNFKDSFLESARSKYDIKIDMLNDLCSGKEISPDLQEEMSGIMHHEMLDDKAMLLPFDTGTIKLLEEFESYKVYHAAWSYYDAMYNRPVICFMKFEFHKNGEPLSPEYSALFWSSISKKDRRTIPMRLIAEELDYEIEAIRPKEIKRLDIGPLVGKYSKDEDELTEFIKNITDEWLLKFSLERIYSKDEIVKEYSGKKRVYQVYKLASRNHDTVISETSELHKYAMCSHSLSQSLYDSDLFDEFLNSLSLSLITFVK